MGSYIELTKPRITVFILMSTAIGFFCGQHVAGDWSWLVLLHTLVGTGLLASGTAALNQWYEREADAKMARTRKRPLPSERLAPDSALGFGIALSICGFAELWLGVNRLSALLGLFTLLSYLCVYTPLKRKTPSATTIGAVPGAMPPLIGYAAAAGLLNTEAWILYAILFLWQFPHFYAIAWMYREDYANADMKMLPVVEPDGVSTARRIFWLSLLLIPVSLAPRYFELTGNLYLFGSLAVGLYFAYAGMRALSERTRPYARKVLLASIVYLPVLYGLLLVDRTRF